MSENEQNENVLYVSMLFARRRSRQHYLNLNRYRRKITAEGTGCAHTHTACKALMRRQQASKHTSDSGGLL